MGSFMAKLFIDVSTLPTDGYGFIQLLFLGAVYGVVLMRGSNLIKDGSELLLLIPSLAGIVGSIVLPVLGAVPDGAIVIFSGLGDDAQEQVAVGIGALAGSTVMLLTVPWVLCLVAGRVNMQSDGRLNYIKPTGASAEWRKLDPPSKFFGTACQVSPAIAYTAKIMILTLVSFFIVQIPAVVKHCAATSEKDKCESPPVAALVGAIVAILLFCFYLWDQARLAKSDETKQHKIDALRQEAIASALINLRTILLQETGETVLCGHFRYSD